MLIRTSGDGRRLNSHAADGEKMARIACRLAVGTGGNAAHGGASGNTRWASPRGPAHHAGEKPTRSEDSPLGQREGAAPNADWRLHDGDQFRRRRGKNSLAAFYYARCDACMRMHKPFTTVRFGISLRRSASIPALPGPISGAGMPMARSVAIHWNSTTIVLRSV